MVRFLSAAALRARGLLRRYIVAESSPASYAGSTSVPTGMPIWKQGLPTGRSFNPRTIAAQTIERGDRGAYLQSRVALLAGVLAQNVCYSAACGLALLALSCHAAASQKWHSFAALVVVHVEAICQSEEANHRRSGGCSDMISGSFPSADIEWKHGKCTGIDCPHEEFPCGGMQSRAAARTQPSATG